MAKASSVVAKNEPTITQIRVVDAPRELVWKVWTEAKHVAQWWGPNGFTNTIHEMAVKPGGVWLFVMHGPDGTDYDNKIVFHEVVKPERLVYTHSGGDAPDDPHRFEVVVTFTDIGGKTEVVMRSTFPSLAARDGVIEFGAVEGGRQTLDRLADYLAKL